ncbi:hypothetical protein HMI55_001366 [Coelomomyces lativittatus]|nr:hypothetical protein HMI55_001366 [Coelomomyces lativittatus]
MEYFKEGAVTMEKEELRYESPSPSISSYAIPSIPFHQPPLARTSPKSVSRVEAEKPKQEYRELMLVPLPSSQVKCYKPTFKDPPHADGSSKHIQFIDPFLFPSTSIPPIPDPPKSILKKVSISDSAPSHSSSVTPSVGSLPTVDPAPNTPITLTPSTKEKKAMASPTYPSPSYVLVPANLLPSLFPVIPPIANYPWTSTEQQWGLPPRPKSMLEYVSHTKRTSPRPYSATPPLSYYEQYLLSRK